MASKSADGVTVVEQGTYLVPDISIKELLAAIPSVTNSYHFFSLPQSDMNQRPLLQTISAEVLCLHVRLFVFCCAVHRADAYR